MTLENKKKDWDGILKGVCLIIKELEFSPEGYMQNS